MVTETTDNKETTTTTETPKFSAEEFAALQEKATALESEAAKQRGIAKKAIEERDALKKAKKQAPADDGAEDYKALWQEEAAAKSKLLDAVKSSTVTAAVTAKLLKIGVLPDAVEAATKLIDKNIIQWDPESGLEDVTVDAAVQLLKKSYPFMFERKVSATNPKIPADGSPTMGEKEISRADFDRLSPKDQMDRVVKKGWKVVD